MATHKAFSVGVLNVSKTAKTKLDVRFLAPPEAWQAGRLSFSKDQNAKEWVVFKETSGVTDALRTRRVVLPETLFLLAGERAKVADLNVPEPPGSPARQVMAQLGRVPRERVEPLFNSLKRLEPSSDPGLDYGELCSVTVVVPVPEADTAAIVRILHTTDSGAPIGAYTVVFTDDQKGC